ncbi:MAG: HPF/RaiA family ribosome-associated protein [Chromatiales bacterium]|nr:HPF/RaiA family ribosome-associated protein [Chromatiales bacterium]
MTERQRRSCRWKSSSRRPRSRVHVRGKDIFVEAIDGDLYAAIDALADKLDRQVLKYKEKIRRPHARQR